MDYGFVPDPGETITRVVHRHILSFVPTILMSLGLLLVAGFFAYFDGRFPDQMPFPPIVTLALVTVLVLLSGVILLIGLKIFRGNMLIFTNIHLVHVEQLALFQKRVSQLSFLRVEDVTGRRVGFFQVLFNYGDVEVQSAGETEKFIFKYAPNPQVVADEALQIHEQCLRDAGLNHNSLPGNEIG